MANLMHEEEAVGVDLRQPTTPSGSRHRRGAGADASEVGSSTPSSVPERQRRPQDARGEESDVGEARPLKEVGVGALSQAYTRRTPIWAYGPSAKTLVICSACANIREYNLLT